MPSRLVQRIRWIGEFATDKPRELKRQLNELQRGFYGTVTALADGISSLLSGLDGIDVVGNTVRISRDVKVFAAGGNNLGGIATKDILRFELTAHATVTGFVAPGANDTHRKLVVNASAYTLTFTHDATSTVTNRLMCPHLVAFVLAPSECAWIDYDRTSQRWRVAQQSQPVRIVRTLTDLPAAVAGDITLTPGVLWYFVAHLNIGTNTLVIPDDVLVVASYTYNGVEGTGTPVVQIGSFDRDGPFYVAKTGGSAGYAVECTGQLNVFHNWTVFGGLTYSGGGSLHFDGGHISTLDVYAGNTIQAHGTKMHQVRILGTSQPLMILMNGVQQNSFSAPNEGTLLTVAAGVQLPFGLKMIGCGAGGSNKLVDIGADMTGMATILGCTSPNSGGITVAAIPDGGLVIEACSKMHATTPFSGFTALTAGVVARANYDTNGVLLQETPNGHIVKNNAGTDQTQRHYLKYAYPLATSDDGTSTVVGLGEEEAITFADDGSGGTLGAALFDVSGLPDNCVALVRVAASWGASSGTAAEIDNLDGAGVAYAVISCNGGTLVHVQTEPFNGSADTQFHIMTLVSDTPSEPAIFLGIDSGQLQLSVALSGLTYASPFLSGSGTLIVENIWERGLQS